ncbi:MAG: hypothetical protein K8E24_005115 [Methanobacterium paludis]|nr:hypothetical protein [Methanobacterium paludis]
MGISEIGAIFYLIIGIFFIIFSILAINHYRLHPEKEGALISTLIPFILGMLLIIGIITGHIELIILSFFIIFIIILIYPTYNSIKYPEMKKKREKAQEVYKKHPLYKLLRICRYILLACATFLGIFVLIVVLFNITF